MTGYRLGQFVMRGDEFRRRLLRRLWRTGKEKNHCATILAKATVLRLRHRPPTAYAAADIGSVSVSFFSVGGASASFFTLRRKPKLRQTPKLRRTNRAFTPAKAIVLRLRVKFLCDKLLSRV